MHVIDAIFRIAENRYERRVYLRSLKSFLFFFPSKKVRVM